MVFHRLPGTPEDIHNLLHAEAVEELAHPNGVRSVFIQREAGSRIKQVDSVSADPFASFLPAHVLLHHGDLLREVEHANTHIRVVRHTLKSPLAGVAAHIVKRLHMMLVEYHFQSLGECRVAVEMVESKPTFLHLRGQARKTLVDGGPVAEMAQTFRASVAKALLQSEPPLIVHVVVKVDIHACGRVVQQKPSCLRQRETVGRRFDNQYAGSQRGLRQAFHGIVRQATAVADLSPRGPTVLITDEIQDAESQHQARHLENGGPPGDELSQPLCLTGRKLFFGVFVECRRKMHDVKWNFHAKLQQSMIKNK